MSLRHVILGLLEREALSGYQIKRKLKYDMPNLWQVSDGQLYPTLKRLQAEQFIVANHQTEPATYALTAAGRQELTEWLRQPVAELPDWKDPFLARLILFDHLRKDEVLRQIETQRRAIANERERLLAYRQKYVPRITSFQRAVADFAWLTLDARETFLTLLAERVQQGRLSRLEPLVAN